MGVHAESTFNFVVLDSSASVAEQILVLVLEGCCICMFGTHGAKSSRTAGDG